MVAPCGGRNFVPILTGGGCVTPAPMAEADVEMVRARVLALGLGGLLLAGCTTTGRDSASLSLANAPVPGAVAEGGVLNNAIGAGLDELDRQRALNAEISALEEGGPGTPVGWRGDNGAHGTVIAGPAYQRAGYVRCRDFSHTIFLQGRTQLSRGAACRASEGGWKAVTIGV